MTTVEYKGGRWNIEANVDYWEVPMPVRELWAGVVESQAVDGEWSGRLNRGAFSPLCDRGWEMIASRANGSKRAPIVTLRKTSMRETGTVKWFSNAKGYGFIEREGAEDVFVHIKQCRVKMEQGNKVSFQISQGRKGPVAVNVEAR